MQNILKGIGIGTGIAIAKSYVLKEVNLSTVRNTSNSVEEELKLFHKTHETAKKQIEQLIEIATKTISKDKAEIFAAHLEIMKDEVIIDEMKELISSKVSHSYAIETVFNKYHQTFSEMEDKYFRERATDIKDIQKRLLVIALNIELPDLLLINEESIIVAHDLTPSETALLNKKFVKGFITNIGGSTSHSAIMAKTLGIPAVVSLKTATSTIKNGEIIALDSSKGLVEHTLSSTQVKEWTVKQEQYAKIIEELALYKDKECKSLDGVSITLQGNIGHPKDVKKVFENGGHGVGLFRSEFLYMDATNWPTEEEQFTSYKDVLSQVDTKHTVTIRTLDIGGDKHLTYYTFPKEQNPFLGYRALRMSLKEQDIFIVQLRALLRASVHGNLKIMFPMVTTYDEFLDAKTLTLKVAKELEAEGIKVSKNLSIGMMIEIPSSALLANKFAEIADFFSIGSNDLIQYTHAADRMSEEVNYLYQPNSPSILKLIKMSADAAIKHNKGISVCGEMASNAFSVLLLIGLGIKHLSMSAGSISSIKRIINNVKISDCSKLAEQALECRNEKEINELVSDFLKARNLSI